MAMGGLSQCSGGLTGSLLFWQAVASGLVAYFLLTYKILAGRGYQFWVLGGLGAVLLLLILLNGLKRLGKTTLVLATIVILGASYGAYQMNATVNFFNKLNTNTQKKELTMSLATLAEGGVARCVGLRRQSGPSAARTRPRECPSLSR